MKKVARVGDKVAGVGVVSGGPCTSSNTTVSSVQCQYADTSKEVGCIFPFIGDNPGQKTGGRVNTQCRTTKRGRHWCATKLSLDNRVIGASDQSRDVVCPDTKLACAPSSKSTTTTTKRTTASPQTKKTTSRPKVDDGVTDRELLDFTENLLNIDDDDVSHLIKIDTGCSTR